MQEKSSYGEEDNLQVSRSSSANSARGSSIPGHYECPTCARLKSSSGTCTHRNALDSQLMSILDPFTKVPLKLSKREQTLLQDCMRFPCLLELHADNKISRPY